MKELGKWGTSLMVIGLVIAVGVLMCGAFITQLISLEPDNWRFWVVVRITLQVGIAFGLGLLFAKAAELPWVPWGGVGIVVGLLAAWSATPDLIEGPVAIDGYVTDVSVTHGVGGWSRQSVWGEGCLQTDAGVELCLHPEGMKALRMSGKVGCLGHLHALVLRHLDVLLAVKCTPEPDKYQASNITKAADENRRRARRARIALSEARLQTDKDRQAWAAQLATADADLYEGILLSLDSKDTWAVPALEGAILQRHDYLDPTVAYTFAYDFPEQARAFAKREHDRGGNVHRLEYELKKDR